MNMFNILYITISVLLGFAPPQWRTNIREAQDIARKEHRHILLNFSGSDWCGPCILLKKEVFDDAVFAGMADTSLVLVNADFPRMKKNQPSKEQQKINDAAADRYNPKGVFPLTLLLTTEGGVLKQWEGNPGLTPTEFCRQLRTTIDADKQR
jgi:thioredoxin-related protein